MESEQYYLALSLKGLTTAIILLTLFSHPAFAKYTDPGQGQKIFYSGSVVNSKGNPVSGIFWMRFSLHRTQTAREAVWMEERYVAIDDGHYELELGTTRPIPPALQLPGMYLAIAIDGVEVQRVVVTPQMVVGAPPIPGKQEGVCARCEVALKAVNCEKFAGLTLKQLAYTLSRQLLKVGQAVRYSGLAGSGKGKQFKILCPSGYVATGIKGTIDDNGKIAGLQLICAPLEAK